MFRKLLLSILKKFLEPVEAEAKKVVDFTNAKQNYVDNAEEQNKDEWLIDLGFCEFIHDVRSWSLARNAGYEFMEMLKQIDKNTYKMLYTVGSWPEVKKIEISSAWRPGGGVHSIGLGIDIQAIHFESGVVHCFRKSNATMHPSALKKLRLKLWETGLINQWIGPWSKRGVLGEVPGWHKNNNRTNVCKQHRNHVHLTIRKG